MAHFSRVCSAENIVNLHLHVLQMEIMEQMQTHVYFDTFSYRLEIQYHIHIYLSSFC